MQVSEQDLQRVESRIRDINSFAQQRRAQQANVSLDFVLGLEAHNADRLEVSTCLLCMQGNMHWALREKADRLQNARCWHVDESCLSRKPGK